MIGTIRKAALAAGVGVASLAAAAAGTLTAGAAQAAPVAVQQVPAQGIITTGIGYWSLYAASIQITTAGPGEVWLSAPAGEACGRGAEGALVRFDFYNVESLRSGSGTVYACGQPSSTPRQVKLYTGPGRVAGTISIVSSGGNWSIPGGATFVR